MSVTITGLPAGSTLTGAELVPVVQSSTTVRTTTQAIADLAGGGLPAQTGHAGEYLTTDGNTASWETLLVEGLDAGYLDLPQNLQDSDYTLALTDRGKHVYQSQVGAATTWTIPANADVDFPIGAAIAIVNDGGVSLDIDADGAVTIVQAGTGIEASLVVLDVAGMATLIQVDVDRWYINGVGITVPA